MQGHSAPQPQNSTDYYDTIAFTETYHGFVDPITIGNRVNLEGESTFTPNSEHHALIIYQPVEEVEAELMTQSAYDLLFPLPPFTQLGGQAVWGHESFYAQPVRI